MGDLIAKQLDQTGKTKQLEQSERNTGKLKQSLVAHGWSDEIEIMMTGKLSLRLRYFCNGCTNKSYPLAEKLVKPTAIVRKRFGSILAELKRCTYGNACRCG